MKIKKDISGQRFGKLTAIEPTKQDKKRNTYWLCECDCGNRVERKLNDLTHGYTKSCGCLRKEKPTTHGKSANGENYERWKAMKKRCLNPNDRYFHRYGGRGIRIFDEWVNDFDAFDKFGRMTKCQKPTPKRELVKNGTLPTSPCWGCRSSGSLQSDSRPPVPPTETQLPECSGRQLATI